MSNGIYAVVKRYEKEENGKIIIEFAEWCYKPNDHYVIYEKIMELSNENHDLSSDAASWCELATVGEIYETRDWEIEIQDID